MNPSAIISEIKRLNAGIVPKIEELEQNNTQLERYIGDADKNWNDNVKERFFSGPVTNVREAHKSQIMTMKTINSQFESGERTIFSMI
jgi:hypothetical protein